MEDKDLVPTVVDLSAAKENKLNESFLSMFGGAVQMMLKSMFGGTSLADTPSLRTMTIKGTPSQVAAFGDALANEKRYMQSFMKNGLGDSATLNSRHKLDAAVARFERETGLKWPFK